MSEELEIKNEMIKNERIGNEMIKNEMIKNEKIGNETNETSTIQVVEKWDDFDLNNNVLRGIYANGFENPSQIQKTAIKPLIDGRDLIAQAQSGTGKTGAFTIGSLQRVDITQNTTQILILAPTHELVEQITTVVTDIGQMMPGLVVQTLIGGTSTTEDAEKLRKTPPHIIIGTVGRTYDMIRRRNIQMKTIKMFVMDEADEMLSRGFKDQIYDIYQYFNPNTIQVALFSATMHEEMLQMTNKFMRNPVKITVEAEKLNLEGIEQYYVAVEDDRAKFNTLKDIYGFLSLSQCIIYCNSVPRVVDLYDAMMNDGFPVCCIHSSMNSQQRKNTISDFRKGTYRVMISSDITARGIDVQQVSTVINFDIPTCNRNYLHRIGRSGRWGRKGRGINFVTRRDVNTLRNIENHYKIKIDELPANVIATA